MANGGVLAGARIKVGNNAATGELTASLEAATGAVDDLNKFNFSEADAEANINTALKDNNKRNIDNIILI